MTEQPIQRTLLIASYLEPEHVERIRQVDPRLRVLYEPELLPPPRYPADHHGHPITRNAEQEARWRALLAEADILFDFDQTHLDDLPERAPRLRWIQATSAGIGQFVRQRGYDQRMPNTLFTTASGVHAQPLAEFVIMAMLYFTKEVPRMLSAQSAKRWERTASLELSGRTVAIVGVGRIGKEVARVAHSFNMRVIGNKRHPEGIEPASLNLDELFGPDGLEQMLPQADFLVLVTPHTDETEHLIGEEELKELPKGAILINIARGAVVDETSLVEALRSGHLGGAALDVFAAEPLPTTSPLWELPNVLVSPHSASTSLRENERITALFCDNLRRFLNGQPLLNRLDTQRLY